MVFTLVPQHEADLILRKVVEGEYHEEVASRCHSST